MEVLIFGSFVVLALVALAFHFISRQSDDQKKSVSNVNFVSFQRSFFVVYFMALFGDWLQGPYVYKLYSYYGYPESQVKFVNSWLIYDIRLKILTSISPLGAVDVTFFILSDCGLIRGRICI